MPEFDVLQGRFLEIRRLPLYACYEVMLRKDAFVSLVQFPDDAEILQLWQETNQSRLSALRQPPSRPYGKHFLLAPIDEEVRHPAYFLTRLEARCVCITPAFTPTDLATARINLSHSPLFLVSFVQNGEPCEAFVTAEQAANILNPEFSRHRLMNDVIELQGSRIIRRAVTVDERKMINDMAWRNG